MPADPRNFKAPFISQQACWDAADNFRAQFMPSGSLPVDVLAVAEFDLELDLRPIQNLRQEADVDALLLPATRVLLVDQQQYMRPGLNNRLRFSVAHEIGHLVLHQNAFENFRLDTVEDFLRFFSGIPEREYSFLEFHAYEFAGRLLVPADELRTAFESALDEAALGGIPRHSIDDAHLSYLCKPLAKRFEVSPDVIEKRLRRERLWPFGNV